MIKLKTLLILLFFCAEVQAQIQIIPLAPDKPKTEMKARIKAAALSLPFWDDFSSPGQPETTFWQNSENVFVNDGLSYDPPSLYVASFDGLDVNGNPYAPGSAEGPADSLTSVPIDLSPYLLSDNIYLSFFYEWAGLGDQPEPKDSLQLQFRNSSGEWESVWPASAQDLDRSGDFVEIFLPVNRSEWLHDAFQMRFQSYGRLSGSFDLWNIDYVYMNTNRNFQDDSYPDRAISEPITGFLGIYRQVPYAHFTYDQLTEPSFRLRNLVNSPTNQNKAYNYYFNYQIDVTDTLGNTTNWNNSSFIEPLESPIASGSSEKVNIREPFPDFSGNPAADSAHLLLEVILDAEDNIPISGGGDYDPARYSPIDFQENDTIRNEFILADTYAYDDGSAELGAGLNAAGDRLAYLYELRDVEEALMTGIDIYFPFTGTSPNGKQIELTVWDNAEGIPGSVMYRQLVNAQQSGSKNELVRYKFATPVMVSGVFYIGYKQNAQGALAIGLDANTSTGDKLLFNLGELWEVNSLVQGSLMMRPVFGEVEEIIVGVEDDLKNDITPYPNPVSQGTFYLNYLGDISVTDLSGRTIGFSTSMESGRTRVSIQASPGIYLVHADGQSWKIIIP